MKTLRCAIYTRKSSEEGLEQEFNSLDAQREACEAFAISQKHEGWQVSATQYDDGGFSGGNTDRPALARLLEDIHAGEVDILIVYKVDRLSRSLVDFVKLVELFEQQSVSFVSVTQQFNTSTSMGRLTLNVLLSFAQFEREVTGERIRDKIRASKKKGMWTGGPVPIGYEAVDKKLIINLEEAEQVRHIFARYLALGCVRKLKAELDSDGYVSKRRGTVDKPSGGLPHARGALYRTLKNPLYIGKVQSVSGLHDGRHQPIVDDEVWKSVQARLGQNRTRNGLRSTAKEPSLLAGLLFDDQGNPMSPTHTRKGSRRYRYYVSQAVLQFRENDVGTVKRISAQKLESAVLREVLALFKNPKRLHQALGEPTLDAGLASQISKSAKIAHDVWETQSTSQTIASLKQTIARATVQRTGVTIEFIRSGLASFVIEENREIEAPDDHYVVEMKMRFKTAGVEPSAVLAESTTPVASSVRSLQQAVLRGLRWNEQLLKGEVSSLTAVAKREGVTQPYVGRLVRLATLDIDILERIARGDVPAGLTLEALKWYS